MDSGPNASTETLEFEGRTVDEAIDRGLRETGLSREQVTVEVLDEGSRGVLSIFGARPARVRLQELRAGAAAATAAERVITRMLDLMGLPSDVSVRTDSGRIEAAVNGSGADGLLIGRKGETLFALQHIVGRIVNRATGGHEQVVIDVGGYRGRREAQLVKSARQLARRVRETGREQYTEPLSASERRTIHLALAEEPGVKTHAVGEGLLKKIAITPAAKEEGSGAR
jgi:spoIIIJ-associated protein